MSFTQTVAFSFFQLMQIFFTNKKLLFRTKITLALLSSIERDQAQIFLFFIILLKQVNRVGYFHIGSEKQRMCIMQVSAKIQEN